jgi:hypothetical protein
MGGLIFVFLLALLVAVLVTPAIRTRFGQKPPPSPPGQESPHEVVIRRLDDHRARRNTPRDDASDKKT